VFYGDRLDRPAPVEPIRSYKTSIVKKVLEGAITVNKLPASWRQTGMLLGLGLIIGAGIGVALSNAAVGIAIGLAIGVAMTGSQK
jgi:hypothetical protein